MKSIKKLFAMLGVMLAMSVVVMPLAGWTSAASADEAETAIQTAAIGGVETLGGGTQSETLDMGNGRWVKFRASAGNWIWPATDEAVITVESSYYETYISFEVEFVWTNAKDKTTYWRYPRLLDLGTGTPMNFLDINDENKYKTVEKMNCNDSQLMGDAGQRWACDHIYLRGFARLGSDGPIKSCTIGPVYF